MNVPNDELDTMAETALRVNKCALDALSAIGRGDTAAAADALSEIQRRNWNLRKRLLNSGAVDASKERADRLQDEFDSTGFPELMGEDSRPHALELLSSHAAERFAHAIRETANACREMESERGILGDGVTEWYEIAADTAELEVFGPKELR